MALTHHEQSMLQIVLKKLSGRATTQTPIGSGPGNESLPTNVQVSSTTVFADPVPDMPRRKLADATVPAGFGSNAITCVFCDGSNNEIGANYDITDTSGNLCDGTQAEVDLGNATYAYENGIVESVKLNLVGIEASKYSTGGSNDIIGIHGYYTTLPNDYQYNSNNPSKGAGTWDDDKELFKTLGKIQAVPPIYGFDPNDGSANGSYPGNIGSDSRIYNAILRDVNGEIIPKADPRNWYYDYYSGVYFQEITSTDGTTTDLPIPATIEVLLFVGRYVSDVLDVVLDFTPTGNVAGLLGDPRDDSDYDTDGFFQTWETDTPTGHAMDDVNEKLLTLHDNIGTLTGEFDILDEFVHGRHPPDTIYSANLCPDVNKELYGSTAPVGRHLTLQHYFREARLSTDAPWGTSSNGSSSVSYTGGTGDLSPAGALPKAYKGYEFESTAYYWSSGWDRRLGIFHSQLTAGTPVFGTSSYTEFKFDINYNVTTNYTTLTSNSSGQGGPYNQELSYPAKSFGRGEEGTLKLYLNDQTTPLLSIDLSTANDAGEQTTTTGGSQLNIGELKYGKMSDGTDDTETARYRKGPNNWVKINLKDMRVGWNFAQVTHEITGEATKYSTYVTWIIDSNTLEPYVDSALIGPTLNGAPTYSYLSGVKFASNISFNYGVNVNNVYTNFYYTTNLNAWDNCNSCPSGLEWSDYTWIRGIIEIQKAEDASWHNSINTTDYTIEATGTHYPVYWTVQTSFSGSIKIRHPYDYATYNSSKSPGWSNLDNTMTKTWIHDATLRAPYPSGGSDISDWFYSETYRLITDDYDTQSSIPATGNWNSQLTLDGIDGLLVWNGALRSPRYNGGNITNGNFNTTVYPPSNVNYTNLTTGVRYYYRAFKNVGVNDLKFFEISIIGSGTIVNFDYNMANDGGDTDNIQVGIKVPSNVAGGVFAGTGWLDATISKGDTVNLYSDGTGILAGETNNNANFSIDLLCDLGAGRTLKAGDSIVIRIVAHSTWTGYISAMHFSAA